MTFRSRTRTPIEKQLAAIVERLAAAEPENQHLIPPDWAGSDQRVRLEGFQHVLTAHYSQLEPRWASALAGGGADLECCRLAVKCDLIVDAPREEEIRPWREALHTPLC